MQNSIFISSNQIGLSLVIGWGGTKFKMKFICDDLFAFTCRIDTVDLTIARKQKQIEKMYKLKTLSFYHENLMTIIKTSKNEIVSKYWQKKNVQNIFEQIIYFFYSIICNFFVIEIGFTSKYSADFTFS